MSDIPVSDIPVSEMESQLRILMNIAAGDPLRRLNAQAVRRRAVKRRAATLLAGVAATVLVLCVGAVVAVATTGSVRGPASYAGLPAGMPRFYIEQGENSSGFPTKTVIRATASGAVTGTVACPWPGAHVAITSIVPADDQEFFMVCARFLGRILTSQVAGSRIYRFQLTSAGQVDGYSLVRGGVLNGLQVDSIAVTPDGSEVAVSLDSTGHFVLDVIVIDTRTGAHAVWHGASRVPGTVIYPIEHQGLSFTANGQELALFTHPQCVKGKNAPPCRAGFGGELRAVSHPASGGKLSDSRLLLRLPFGLDQAMISPDGRTVILTGSSVPLSRHYYSITRVSVASGKQVGVLFRERIGEALTYWDFSPDPSCRFFILVIGPSIGRLVNGGVGDGRLFRLKPRGEDIYQEAW